MSPRSGLITVRLPRAVDEAAKAGYCHKSVLEPLLEAGASGELSHHMLSGFELYSDPGNACRLSAAEKTGSSLWYASTVFIDHLLSAAGGVAPGCRVCEVGSGCGAVGLALWASRLSCAVTLTDQAHMLPLLFLNSAHNAQHRFQRGSRGGCNTAMPRVASLPWGDSEAAAAVLEHAPGGHFDLIIGSDVTYEPSNHEALLATLADLANGRIDDVRHDSGRGDGAAATQCVPPARVLLAAPDWLQPGQTTSNSLRDGFLDRSAAHGWRWEVVSTTLRSGPTTEWIGAASKSTYCPVVILMGKPPPREGRCRVQVQVAC